MGRTEQTVVTDFDEAWGKDVLQEAADELLGLDGAVLELVSGRLFVGEREVAILQLAQAVVGDSHAKDVRGEILEGLLTGAHGFGMDHPGFLPDPGRYLSKEFRLLESITELG